MVIKNLIRGSPTSRQTCFAIGAYLRYLVQQRRCRHGTQAAMIGVLTWMGHGAVFYGETRENRLMIMACTRPGN